MLSGMKDEPKYIKMSSALLQAPKVFQKRSQSLLETEIQSQKYGNLGIPLIPQSQLSAVDNNKFKSILKSPMGRIPEKEWRE